jgi:hypothetical protein
VAALALLICIGWDVALDASCDPLAVRGGEAIEALGPFGDGDCAPVCVPDCFCCSRAVGVDLDFSPAWAGNVETTLGLPAGHVLEGVAAGVFHPPLLRA